MDVRSSFVLLSFLIGFAAATTCSNGMCGLLGCMCQKCYIILVLFNYIILIMYMALEDERTLFYFICIDHNIISSNKRRTSNSSRPRIVAAGIVS